MKSIARLLSLVVLVTSLGTLTACGKTEEEKNKDMVNSMGVRLNAGNKAIDKGNMAWEKVRIATGTVDVEKMTVAQLTEIEGLIKEAKKHYGNAHANFSSILTDDSKSKGVTVHGNLPQTIRMLDLRLKEIKELEVRVKKAQENPAPAGKSAASGEVSI